MRALVVQPGTSREPTLVADRPEPVARDGEVKIRVRMAGVCSTDLEIVRGYMGFTGVPGHEFVGTVVEGDERLCGRRVVGEINCGCGECDWCRRGLGNHCPNRTVLGIVGRDGAFSEYCALPAANCHVVPDVVNDRAAVFVEPLAAAVHVLDAHPIEADTRVALLGTGRLGLLVAQVLALHTSGLDVIGRNPRTLELCREWGLRTISVEALEPRPEYEVVVDCTGSPEGLRLAQRVCRPLGTIVLKSTYAAAEPVDLAPVVIHEMRVVGNRCGSFEKALPLLAEGRIRVDELISVVMPLTNGPAALAAAARPENIKVLLETGAA